MIEYYVGTMEEDFDSVVELCGTWWEDSLFYKTYGCEYNVHKQVFIDLDNNGSLLPICGKDLDTGEVVACYIAVITPYIYNPKLLVSSEMVWCLREDYRKGKEVFRLLQAIEIVLKAHNIDIYNICLQGEEEYKTLGDFLEHKKGYTRMETSYSKLLGD